MEYIDATSSTAPVRSLPRDAHSWFVPASSLERWTEPTPPSLEVLEDFELSYDISKKSAQDFVRRLVKTTNGRDPGNVDDRYREFMRVVRQYRHLRQRQWSGAAHDGPQDQKNGQMALFCAACPQPGLNLPENWQTDADQYASKINVAIKY